jgi:hypothetical protein
MSYFSFSDSALIPFLNHDQLNSIEKRVRIQMGEAIPPIHFRINTAKSDLYTSASKKREIGNQLHDLLAQLPDMDSWPALRAKSSLDLSLLDALLAIPKVQSFFNKDQLVFKEVDLLCPDGKIIRPDRVNKVDGALQVIDFKTGRPKPEHHDQINRYKQTLVSMGHQVTEGVLIYVESKELIYV